MKRSIGRRTWSGWAARGSVALALILAGATATQDCRAQAVTPHEALEDAKLYFTAPVRWDARDWLAFGGSLAAVAVAHEFDDDVRDHFVGGRADQGLGKGDSHGADDALPAAALVAGTWVLAGITHDRGGYRELGSMLEAAGLSVVTAELLKLSLGRQRPNETADPDQWFKSGNSFPSSHATAAFAIGTVFAESGDDRYRWLRRVVGYGVAGGTAWLRLDHNAHWTSDVIAGAALGVSTARFTLRRRTGQSTDATTMITPLEGGLLLTYTRPLR
jgi:undecaprenyl-diphosphatase